MRCDIEFVPRVGCPLWLRLALVCRPYGRLCERRPSPKKWAVQEILYRLSEAACGRRIAGARSANDLKGADMERTFTRSELVTAYTQWVTDVRNDRSAFVSPEEESAMTPEKIAEDSVSTIERYLDTGSVVPDDAGQTAA